MKAGAEVGALAERALVSRTLLAEPFESGKACADTSGRVRARSEPPGRDDLVADIFMDFAAGFGDGERHIGDEAVEEVQEAGSPSCSAIAVDERMSMNRSARSSMRGS